MINGLPEKLRSLRLNYNYSQKKLASMLGVSPSLISSYETGERMPSLENLKALAQLYHCSSDYLLGLTAQSSPAVIDVSVLTPEQIAAVHTLIEGISEKTKYKIFFNMFLSNLLSCNRIICVY